MTTPAFIGEVERVPRDEAIRELHDLGAHFVPCHNKKATTSEWQLSRPAIDMVLRRDTKDVAVVPASLGLVAVDIDVKDEPGDKANDKVKRSVERVLAVQKILGAPLATVHSPSGGAHNLYKGMCQEGNSAWAYGEIRGARGYVVLYDIAAMLKAAQLVRDDPTLEPVDVMRLPKRENSKKQTRNEEPRPTPEGLAHLAKGRNNFLNDGVFRDARDGRLTPEREEEWRTAARASGLPHRDVDATIRSASEAGRITHRKDPFSLSDTGNAQFFARMYAEKLRYDHARKASYIFEKDHWTQDRCGRVDQLALEAIHARQHAAVGNEAATKWGLRSLSRPSRDNLLRLARSEPPLSITGDQWDENPWLIGVKGGVVDLLTGEPRDGHPDDLITKVAPVAFNPDAQAPRWIQFLEDVFQDNPDLVPLHATRHGLCADRCSN